MTILFAGGEDADFVPIGLNSNTGPQIDYTGTPVGYRPQFARYGLAIVCPSTKNQTQYQSQNIFSQASFWFSARVWCGSISGSSQNDILQLLDSSNLPRIALRNTTGGATGAFQCCTVDASSTYTAIGSNWTTSFSSAPNAPDRLDVFVNYAVSGTLTVYVNGIQVYTFSGNVTTNSVTALAGFALGAFTYGISSSNAGSRWSEIVVSTTDSRNMSVATLYPIALGNTSNWASATPTTMGAIPVSGNPMSVASSTVVQEFATACNLPASGNYLVNAVVVSAQAECGTTGPQHAQIMLRTASTDYNSSNLNLANTYTWISNVWTTNPNTSSAWTMSDITAAVCKWNLFPQSGLGTGGFTFSTDGLSATPAGSVVSYATQSHASGQRYFEITITTVGNTTNTGVGICNWNVTQNNNLGFDANSLRYSPNGAVIKSNATVATLATYTTANVIGIAVDLVNRMIWFRVGSGNWNNNVANDPASNIGGIDISSMTNGPNNAILPACGGWNTGLSASSGTYTANFGATSFANAAPSGFSGWSTNSASNALNIGIESIA